MDEPNCSFTCEMCDKEYKLHFCCKKENIQIIDGKMYCDNCGSKSKVPVCCGQKTKFDGVE